MDLDKIPLEIIAIVFVQVLEDQSCFESLHQMYILSLVNKLFQNLSLENTIWKYIATKFVDYARLLRRYNATDRTWRDICKERVSDVFIQHEILVGSRENPEKKILIQVHGIGQMYLGVVIEDQTRIALLKRNNSELKGNLLTEYNGTTYVLTPCHMCKTTLNEHHRTPIMYKNNVWDTVDLACYDPTVLILTNDGTVIEFICKPSWDTKWDKFTYPHLIEIDTQVEKIYAMDYCNIALSNGYCYCWSIIEHPLVGHLEYKTPWEIIETKPIRITALDNYYIYFVECKDNFTRFYYKKRTAMTDDVRLSLKSPTLLFDTTEFFDIEKSQIMQFISSSCFTEDEIEEISNYMFRQV